MGHWVFPRGGNPVWVEDDGNGEVQNNWMAEAAAIGRDVFRGLFGREENSAPAIAPHDTEFTPRGSIFGEMPEPPSGGGGPGYSQFPEAPTLGYNPALAARETYARERESRLAPFWDEIMNDLKREGDPRSNPWWLRLAGALGEAASVNDASELGRAVGGYWDRERQLSRQNRADMLRAMMGREELTGQTAEAGFSRQEGDWNVDNTNITNRYNRDVQNTQGQNTYNMQSAQMAQQMALARWQAQMQIWQENQNTMRNMIMLGIGRGGSGGFESFQNLISGLPADVQASLAQGEARVALQSAIESSINTGDRDVIRQLSGVHARMEQLAGGEIPRPTLPRNTRRLDPQVLAQYYSRYVPLDSDSVLSSYPGFSPVGGRSTGYQTNGAE